MSEPAADAFAIPLSLPCEHGLLHGRLTQVDAAAGLVILVDDCAGNAARDELLAVRLRRAGLSTLNIDLLARQEAQFADVQNNVPLLARRLIDFLDLIRKRMQIGELATLPLGLWAAQATSPAALRVAALRDHDIAAVVCLGGLIDLAGMLYLRTLAAPLLVLVEENEARLMASNRRALQEVRAAKALQPIPEIGIDYAASTGFEFAAREAARWFVEHFGAASAAPGQHSPN
jgi:hypothetical protein